MRVWIDLANSPHVPVFAPLICEMEARGHEVLLTARDFAQTLELVQLAGLDVEVVGHHGGGTVRGKMTAIASRALGLRKAVGNQTIDMAISHNSYAHGMAARSLGIPYVTLMDYEHTPANHISFRLAHRVLLPDAIPGSAVRRYGARPSKVVHFSGFKEQIYLDDLAADLPLHRTALPFAVPEHAAVVVVRPPADFAIYHRFENPIFDDWLRNVGSDPAVTVIALPRTPEQRLRLAEMDLPSVVVPETAIPGPRLMAAADLVVSAGGSMNREAAVLGIPAYCMFAGELGAVDRRLEDLGRMVIVRTPDDLRRIEIVRREGADPLWNPTLVATLVNELLETSAGRERAHHGS